MTTDTATKENTHSLLAAGNAHLICKIFADLSSDIKHESNQQYEELLSPFLPILTRIETIAVLNKQSQTHHQHKKSSLSTTLARFSHVNVLREYTSTLHSISHDEVIPSDAESSNTMLRHRAFENGSHRERILLILGEVLRPDPSITMRQSTDLFQMHEPYMNEVIAIIINALAAPNLDQLITIPILVKFSLQFPIGAHLLPAIILNDPSRFECIIEELIQSMTPRLLSSLQHLLLIFHRLVEISPLYAHRILYLLREASSRTSETNAQVIVWMIMDLLHEDPPSCLHTASFYAPFFKQWLSQDVDSHPLDAFFRHASSPTTITKPLDHDKMKHLTSQFLQRLIEDIIQYTASTSQWNSCLLSLLHVAIELVVRGLWTPTVYEVTQLFRSFDRLAKEAQATPELIKSSGFLERCIILMYALILLLCTPLTSALSKIPGQRDEGTKLVLTLAQQCIYSLYSTRAACPLFLLGSVLLYTKSNAIVSLLTSVVHLSPSSGRFSKLLVPEPLFIIGEIIFKPIVTENVMAREVLTITHDSTTNAWMHELLLLSIMGLLTERSFLRHHHGRKLEEWLVSQILEPTEMRIHPLIVSILTEWVENYVMAFEYPMSTKPLVQLSIIPLKRSTVTQRLSHPVIHETYESSEHQKEWSRAVLVLVYCLLFNQRMRRACQAQGTKLASFVNPTPTEETLPPKVLSTDVFLSYDLSSFPISIIYHHVRTYRNDLYTYVAPTLERLMAEEYPELLVHIPRRVATSNNYRPYSIQMTPENGSVLPEQVEISWVTMSMWTTNALHEPTQRLEATLNQMCRSVLPLAILSLRAQSKDNDPTAFLEGFVRLYEVRGRLEHSQWTQFQLDVIRVLVAPAEEWKMAYNSTCYNPLLTRDQLLEQPFTIINAVYQHGLNVTSSPALLRLVIDLVQSFRDQSMFYIRRKADPTWLQMGSEPIKPSEVDISNPTSLTAQAQQLVLVQDCLWIHALCTQLCDAVKVSHEECIRILCNVIDTLWQQENGCQLMIAIHLQGYAVELIPILVTRIPSLHSLWKYWLQSSETSTLRKSVSHSPKVIVEYMNITEMKPNHSFRWHVFLSLCQLYYTSSDHSTIVMILKHMTNRLRTIIVSSTTDWISVHTWVDTILQQMVASCYPHTELRSEVAQHILTLRKHITTSSHCIDQQSLNNIGQVITRAYLRLVQL